MNLPKANPRRHIMVDIETFGTGRDAAIASIGACEFDLEGKIGRTFSAVVDLGASKSPGVLNAATVYWWLQQEEKAARTALIPDSVSDCLPLGQTLRAQPAGHAGHTVKQRAVRHDVAITTNHLQRGLVAQFLRPRQHIGRHVER